MKQPAKKELDAHIPLLPPVEALVEDPRGHGRDLPRDGDALFVDHVAEYLEDDDGDEATDDEDTDELDRATYEAVDGDHGEAWRIRLQIARALGTKPAEIHRRDVAIFGEEIPCRHGDGARTPRHGTGFATPRSLSTFSSGAPTMPSWIPRRPTSRAAPTAIGSRRAGRRPE